jgi:hypothetical protein
MGRDLKKQEFLSKFRLLVDLPPLGQKWFLDSVSDIQRKRSSESQILRIGNLRKILETLLLSGDVDHVQFY